jgi:ferredoxin
MLLPDLWFGTPGRFTEVFMSNTYSTCLLAPDFSIEEITPHPGRPFPATGRSIQLAGGFPTLFPGTEFVLSPTLQVNKDLGSAAPEQLERIARAELARHNQVVVRNYVVDPNFMACVITDNPGALAGFLETYGGILEIEPVLVNTEHTEYPQVTELEIVDESPGYRVLVTSRSPVDKKICTYCGECGPACPENCISPSLRIDYRTCTFCRECETICPVQAIDIYGVQRREIHAPAVILLGDLELELPANKRAIYREDELGYYLETLCSLEIEEAVQCNNDICQYSAKLNAGCDLCVGACRFGAISRDQDGIQVDSLTCTECGRCCAVCPSGAMVYQRFGDRSFTEYFKAADVSRCTHVVLGTEETLHQLWWKGRVQEVRDCYFLEYPCLEALSLFHFLYLFSRGVGQISIVLDPVVEAGPGLEREIASATRLMEELTAGAGAVSLKSVEEFLAQGCNEMSQPARIEVSGFKDRRSTLAELLTGYQQTSTTEITLDHQYGAFGTVQCDPERCTHCYSCLNECKIGALQAGEDSMSLLHRRSLCTGCAVCAEVCPEDALEVSAGTVLDTTFDDATTLAVAEPMLCKECGKEFGTKKSYEKVMQILASKNMTDKGHFAYCDTCRVVKLFGSGGSA